MSSRRLPRQRLERMIVSENLIQRTCTRANFRSKSPSAVSAAPVALRMGVEPSLAEKYVGVFY